MIVILGLLDPTDLYINYDSRIKKSVLMIKISLLIVSII